MKIYRLISLVNDESWAGSSEISTEYYVSEEEAVNRLQRLQEESAEASKLAEAYINCYRTLLAANGLEEYGTQTKPLLREQLSTQAHQQSGCSPAQYKMALLGPWPHRVDIVEVK